MNHACTRHQPGSTTCYANCGCRCDKCREAKVDANRIYRREHRDEIRARRHHPTVRHGIDLDEVAWLLDGGESIWQIAHQLHVTVGGIEKAAERHGRRDILGVCRTAQTVLGEGPAA